MLGRQSAGVNCQKLLEQIRLTVELLSRLKTARLFPTCGAVSQDAIEKRRDTLGVARIEDG